MIDIDPPARKKKFATGPLEPPKNVVPSNIARPSAETVDIGFHVSKDFQRRYKMAAAAQGISMKTIFEESFELWIEKLGLRI